MYLDIWQVRQEGDTFTAQAIRIGQDGLGRRFNDEPQPTRLVHSSLEALRADLKARHLEVSSGRHRKVPAGVLEEWY